MRKRDMTFASAVLEAIDALLALAYIGLQIYYGVCYHIQVFKFVAIILVLLLVYIAITWLQHFPEKLNHLAAEPCECDAVGIAIRDVYSLIMIGLILVVTAYYEYRIFQEIKSLRK